MLEINTMIQELKFDTGKFHQYFRMSLDNFWKCFVGENITNKLKWHIMNLPTFSSIDFNSFFLIFLNKTKNEGTHSEGITSRRSLHDYFSHYCYN